MTKAVYPLGQVLEVKKKRVDNAEKLVTERNLALAKEREILAQKEAERDKVKQHRADKLKQMRDELDGGTNTTTIDQMKKYLDVVKDKLKIEEKKVKDQEAQVETAIKNVEIAKAELAQRRKEVDKIETHKKEWAKEVALEEELKEAVEQDELGSIMFLNRWAKDQ